MGTPIPIPPVIGADYSLCDTILWPPGSTPQFITVFFEGIIACPSAPVDPPAGNYMLSQDPAMPGMWRYLDVDIEILYFLEPWESDLRCWKTGEPGQLYFMHNTAVSCRTEFTNQFANCWAGPNLGIFGTGKILLP